MSLQWKHNRSPSISSCLSEAAKFSTEPQKKLNRNSSTVNSDFGAIVAENISWQLSLLKAAIFFRYRIFLLSVYKFCLLLLYLHVVPEARFFSFSFNDGIKLIIDGALLHNEMNLTDLWGA